MVCSLRAAVFRAPLGQQRTNAQNAGLKFCAALAAGLAPARSIADGVLKLANVSGIAMVERQMLQLARVLAANPRIMGLTSASEPDFATELEVKSASPRGRPETIVIAIAFFNGEDPTIFTSSTQGG